MRSTRVEHEAYCVYQILNHAMNRIYVCTQRVKIGVLFLNLQLLVQLPLVICTLL